MERRGFLKTLIAVPLAPLMLGAYQNHPLHFANCGCGGRCGKEAVLSAEDVARIFRVPLELIG